MIGVPHHLDVVDLAERDVHRQLLRERLARVGRIGQHVEGMHVPEQRTLRVRQVRHVAVRRVQAGGGGVGIAGVLGQEKMIRQPEQRRVAPVARVKLLAVQQ